MARPAKLKALRCAIYTRKSSEEGLEQDFNSLHAQREACEAYILSQRHEGWQVVPAHYDDGGYSGGNIERPGLRQLLEDVRAGQVDVVVVYKVDRLTRALADFAKIVETFDGYGVSFVSVTQQFNTTSSMGRLTLNVLLSFAQFEREVTGERIRDKIAASKKKGMWMGGVVPLGYRAKERTLTIDEPEAALVREIFGLYLKFGTVLRLEEELERRRIRTKRHVTGTGRVVGDRPFSRGHLYKLLTNPLYIGQIQHKGVCHPGLHPAIIDGDIWKKVQALLAGNAHARRNGTTAAHPSPLARLLFDEHGARFATTHATKNGKRYRYYVCEQARTDRDAGGRPVIRLPAAEFERAVISAVASTLQDERVLLDHLSRGDLDMASIKVALAEGRRLAHALEVGGPNIRSRVSEIASRIVVGDTSIKVHFRRGVFLCGTEPVDSEATEGFETATFVVSHPFDVVARQGGMSMVIDGEGAPTSAVQPDAAFVKAVAQGFVWFEELTSGQIRSMEEIATRDGVTDRYVSNLIDQMLSGISAVTAGLKGTAPG